ncbi:MAG: response regulator [Candidatus Aureabacteria bacterium]|nr:response regulator [Candidatus Auribacterota bacterium]
MKRILIVEDDPDMQAIYKFMFKDEAHKYAIQITGNTARALKSIRQRRFDLIISDIIMRDMSGESFPVQVRQEGKNNVPVLVVSVLNPDMLGQLKNMHRVYFLQKPITREKLLNKIGRIVRS